MKSLETIFYLAVFLFHNPPMTGNPDSGIWEIFAGGIWNPGFWNPEYNSRNPLQLPLTNNLESRTWNLESTEWNPVQDCLGFPYVGPP